jgi:4-hydroxy-3-polyprenylbenzoate decarboxylase
MAYKDLREFINILEKAGQLRRIPDEVDWRYEVSGWIRKSDDSRPRGPALLFEKLRGYSYDYRLVSGLIGSYERFAMALGLPSSTSPFEIVNVFRDRIKNPLSPIIVSEGACQENINLGDDIDLLKFPVPWWHPRDGGRYIGTWHGVVSKDLHSGIRNVGMHRAQVFDRNHTGMGMLAMAHISHHFSQRQRIGQPLEIAIVIGADETVPIVAGTGFPPDVDELALAGALRQEPIQLVKCKTVDLEVPANAEIIIEGTVSPTERHLEGPFGEWAGYHAGGVRLRPLLTVTAITYRHQPILRGCLLGKPMTEDQFLYSIGMAAEALRMFESHGPEGVIAVNCPPEGVALASAIVQMRPRYVGHSWNAGRTLISSRVGSHLKTVVLVDDDIDPFDLGQVWWAINTRVQGSRDIEVLRFSTEPRSDPSVPRQNAEFGDKIIIDATKKLDHPYNPVYGSHWAPICMPEADVMDLVELRWRTIIENEKPQPEKEAELRAFLDKEFEEYWREWRAKTYVLSEEEMKAELGRSFPIQKADIFRRKKGDTGRR